MLALLLHQLELADGQRFVLSGLGGLLYNGLLDGGPDGQTLGKRVLKIRVVDEETAEPIGTGRGLGRAAVPAVFGLLGASAALFPLAFLLGIVDGLLPLWDRRRQSIHDKVVHSVVIVA